MRRFLRLICNMFIFWFSEGASLVPYEVLCDGGIEPKSDFE